MPKIVFFFLIAILIFNCNFQCDVFVLKIRHHFFLHAYTRDGGRRIQTIDLCFIKRDSRLIELLIGISLKISLLKKA
jgi:hypothetical protein